MRRSTKADGSGSAPPGGRWEHRLSASANIDTYFFNGAQCFPRTLFSAAVVLLCAVCPRACDAGRIHVHRNSFCFIIYLIYSFWHLSVTNIFSSSVTLSTSCHVSFLFFWAFGRRAPALFHNLGIGGGGPIDAHTYARGQTLSQPPLQSTNSTNPFNSSAVRHTRLLIFCRIIAQISLLRVSVLQARKTWLFNVTGVYQPVGAPISYGSVLSDSPPFTFQSCLVSSMKTKHTFRHSFYYQRSIFRSSTSRHGKKVVIVPISL